MRKLKVLLLGEYSNVHNTLAIGLRALGHEVTVASDGDGWKNYPRDIDISRPSNSRIDGLRYWFKAHQWIHAMRGYDVVQLINPIFLNLKAERHAPFYHRLRRQNHSIFLGAYGIDHYWVKAGCDCTTFRYSDFNMGSELRHNPDNDIWKRDWLWGPKGRLNIEVATTCNGIISGLYEYDASYRPEYGDKLRFIPFPIQCDPAAEARGVPTDKARFFVGVQRERSVYKGTDIMLRALEHLERDLPKGTFVKEIAESVPYERYCTMLDNSNVMLDQLYSYTPAMNALLGMSKGLVIVGGGEPENYDILNEQELRPIVNVQPTEDSVYEALRDLALHPEQIAQRSRDSLAYIRRHHDHVRVAQSYVDFWLERM